MFDFNDAERQTFDLIPANTFCKVGLLLKMPDPFDAGDDPHLFKSKTSDAQYLSADLIVLAGPFEKKHIFQNMMIAGVSEKAVNITRSTLRSILESARGVDPTDVSAEAMAARQVSGFSDFNNLEFAIKVGIEKGKDGYEDKNKIGLIVTPDKKEYAAIMAGEAMPTPAAAVSKAKPAAGPSAPAWAAPKQTASAEAPPTNSAAPPPQEQPKSNIPSWAQ